MDQGRIALVVRCLGAIVGLLVVCPAYAQICAPTPSPDTPCTLATAVSSTWTGLAGDSIWNTAGNWSGGLAPGTAPGDIATFNTATVPSLNGQIVAVGAPITLGNFTSAGAGAAAAFTIAGG